jgi:hypothetical protein
MPADALETIRTEVGLRVAEMRQVAARLSPTDLHKRMDAVRQLAAVNGLAALELLARSSAQRALLPGRKVAVHSCLDRMMDALDSRSSADSTAILAAVAVRLH